MIYIVTNIIVSIVIMNKSVNEDIWMSPEVLTGPGVALDLVYILSHL